MPGYVLDTSALLAVVQDEPGGLEVLEILAGGVAGEVHEPPADETDAPPVFLPFIALMELEYKLRRRGGPYEAERQSAVIRAWPVELVESSPRWRHAAAQLKATYPLSLADAWIASLAVLRSARLVHRDPEFDAIDGLRSLRLPDR
ncbi:MAG TPA: PIN domain-containing protein [Thermoanaerobaculia bacterium]|nr:PIN domain-containing protein [Thermoanaerobaculia bacterium]